MDKKNMFLQSPFAFTLTLIVSCLSLLLSIGFIIGVVTGARATVFIVLSVIAGIIFFVFISLGIKMFLNVVIIDKERIVVKSLIGSQNECKIEKIIAVYRKEFFREGIFYILIDDRQPKNKNIFTRKDSYIRFQCTDKTTKMLKEIWQGHIKNLKLDEYLE